MTSRSTAILHPGKLGLTVDVIKDGWVRVAMPDGLMVREAQLDGRQGNTRNAAGRQRTGPHRSAPIEDRTVRVDIEDRCPGFNSRRKPPRSKVKE